MCEWGGYSGSEVWLNVYQWYWAIADTGTPKDASPVDLAASLGVSVFEAYAVLAKAERYYRSNSRQNARTAEAHSLHRQKKMDLVRKAQAKGIRVNGLDLKVDVIRQLVDRDYPVIQVPYAWVK